MPGLSHYGDELILANVLVNTSGNSDGWKETDLLQEHLNYWIKVIYKARGANASWTWLENISTCITTLRELAKRVNESLAPPNSIKHTTPNLDRDIGALLKSLVEDKIHTQDCSRCFSEEALRTTDVYVTGLQQLLGPNSVLTKFNESRFGKRADTSNVLYAPLSQIDEHTTNAENATATNTANASQPSSNESGPNNDDEDRVGEDLFEVIIGDDDGEPFGALND
ncbi:hypothetical protein RSAG8_08351, partial [Rhizoctonia solani AG-8 WAC10335]